MSSAIARIDFYIDTLDVTRAAIRYEDGTEEDRPATATEIVMWKHVKDAEERRTIARSERTGMKAYDRNTVIEEVATSIESAPLTYAGPDPQGVGNLRYLIVAAIRDLKDVEPSRVDKKRTWERCPAAYCGTQKKCMRPDDCHADHSRGTNNQSDMAAIKQPADAAGENVAPRYKGDITGAERIMDLERDVLELTAKLDQANEALARSSTSNHSAVDICEAYARQLRIDADDMERRDVNPAQVNQLRAMASGVEVASSRIAALAFSARTQLPERLRAIASEIEGRFPADAQQLRDLAEAL